MRYFLVLAEELHFWRTSEKVFMSQSSLSRQIQGLEEELGFKLLERDKRNVKLTEAGKFLQKRWRELLDDMDRAQTQAKKINMGSSGLISIAYPGSISSSFLPELLRTFTAEMPEMKMELVEPTDATNEKLLLDYHIDIAFSRDSVQHPALSSKKLYSEPVCLVVAENHWLNENTYHDFKSLENESFILSGLHHTTFFATLLRRIFTTYGFEPKTHVETDFGGLILNLVANGLGISILPYSFQFGSYTGVRFINLQEEVDLYVNWRKKDENEVIEKIIQHSEALGEKIKARIIL
ncbi:LysR family transcriptional regulator [Aequorivita viscosa]|uniref:Transcriptional regulator, LysR family n=2 Tax=Aequorivita viscosa TaxID=797419 RepID=A0A1M6JIF5_9FLAO|nr:LysR substrate-binding domain-containing protein [Aequorivita viscosa]SDX11352.1 transcriptional regulator, LysR family [Aequorivita viscosa]SHJ46450.1 transcriptional regulator, LysR family [Aequorivita viscosa]